MSADWHLEDIKARVRKRGSSLAELARAEAVTPQAMYSAAAMAKSARLERAIARFLNVTPASIWPSRYHADGTRKCPQPTENLQRRPRFERTEAAAC